VNDRPVSRRIIRTLSAVLVTSAALLVCRGAAAQDGSVSRFELAVPAAVPEQLRSLLEFLPPPPLEIATHKDLLSEHNRRIRVPRASGAAGAAGARGGRGQRANPPPPSSTTIGGGAAGFSLVLNRPLTGAEMGSPPASVAEATAASDGEHVLLTANWFAAWSPDRGTTFNYLNPATFFPSEDTAGFCCDQVAFYDRRHNAMIWVLQYLPNADENLLRVAIATGPDIATRAFRYYDLLPSRIGGWTRESFDFPDVAVTETDLFIAANNYSVDDPDKLVRSVVIRLPLASLSAYRGAAGRVFATTATQGIRLAHGETPTMYFATHVTTSRLRVYAWGAGSTDGVQSSDIALTEWPEAVGCNAPGPDHHNWLARVDSRITAGWRAGGQAGFGWTVGPAPGSPSNAACHVNFAVIDMSDPKKGKRLAETPLWNPDYAVAYPAATADDHGNVLVSLHYGGGSVAPSQAIGRLTSTAAPLKWELTQVASGSAGPSDGQWGDYSSVVPIDKDTWATATFVADTSGSMRLSYVVFVLR
jgi:hypothetical protein